MLRKIYISNPKNPNGDFAMEKGKVIGDMLKGRIGVPYDPPYPEWLFVTIRAILDCKFYEHVQKQDNMVSITSLPDFTYSWLGSF